MGAKKLILIGLGLSVVVFAIGWILRDSINFGLCLVSEPTCINNRTWIGNALYYGPGALSLVFVVLFFLPQAFPAWKKFAIWFVPLAALLFAVYPDPGSGDFFSPFLRQVFQWVSVLYVLISLVIITIATSRTKKA